MHPQLIKISIASFSQYLEHMYMKFHKHLGFDNPKCTHVLKCLYTIYITCKQQQTSQYIISLSVTQSAFASTSDRPLCFPRACVGLIGPRPSDYPHALSACYYFLQAVFLLALGLWSSLPARQLSLDTYYSFLTFSVFFLFFFFKY